MFLFVILSLNDKLCQIPLALGQTPRLYRNFKENKAFGLLPLNKAPTPEDIPVAQHYIFFLTKQSQFLPSRKRVYLGNLRVGQLVV